MGGSQGARKINELMLRAAPALREAVPDLQFLHLTGPEEAGSVRAAYQAQQARAAVHGFLDEMGAALAAADAAVSRAGASSLAELAARQLPAVLIPYPFAADDHQYFNACALARAGAARLLQQQTCTPGQLAGEILRLLRDTSAREAMRQALAAWHWPAAAAEIAERMLHWNPKAGQARAAGWKFKAPNVREMHC
jgi:UDP-N-acetylglucosamine--N-acetylmuramyl-(pentapeptide) pyrophosphoryl-undecaprenol N-acetylglucosamine transferase